MSQYSSNFLKHLHPFPFPYVNLQITILSCCSKTRRVLMREAHFRENRGVQEYSRDFVSISMTWFINCWCQIILQLMPLTHMLFNCIVYIFSTQCTDKKLFKIMKYKIEYLLAWVPWHPNQDTELRSSSVV